MSRFDWCAVDSAGEDNPTPVDFNADNQRPQRRTQSSAFPPLSPRSPRLRVSILPATLSFPWRFRSSTLANNGDGTCCRRDPTREPSARTRRHGVGVNRKHSVVRRAAVNGGRYAINNA